jgi:protein-S-isoprenylcysteine O-methyltransferase Ste14
MMSLPIRVILNLAGTIVWFGLALLAWGDVAAFFRHAPLVGLAVVQGALVAAAIPAGGNLSSGVTEDRRNRWVLIAFGILGMLLAWVPAWTDRREIWVVDGETVRWLGVALFAIGGVLRLWPVFVLGNRFSGLVAIQEGHALVTDGIYRVVRNPSYLGLLLNALGWSLAFRSVAGIVLTALFIPPLIARMIAEERLLLTTFGPAYEAYRARTWRLIPYLY